MVIKYLDGNTETQTFTGNYLGENVGQNLTTDDRNNMAIWRTQLNEEKDAQNYENVVRKGVFATLTKTEEYHLRLDITTNLATLYPNKEIVYYVKVETQLPRKYKYGNMSEEFHFNDKNKLYVENLYALNYDYYLLVDIYDNIMQKKKSGVSLTTEEDLLKETSAILNDYCSYTTFTFYVEINGKRYDIPTK